MALTDKQIQFFKEYMLDSNATQAAIRAGYSKNTAYSQGQRLLKNVEGQEFLREMMAERDKTLVADQNEVLEYLTRVMRGESTASVLARNMVGADEVIEKPPDEKEKLRAAELLGRRYSLFTEKFDVNASVGVTIVDDIGE